MCEDGCLVQRPLSTVERITMVCDELKSLLIEKNQRYGDSALNPISIFNKADSLNSVLIRIDDKLSRIKNSDELRKNDVSDLIGYLILLLCSKEWLCLRDLLD